MNCVILNLFQDLIKDIKISRMRFLVKQGMTKTDIVLLITDIHFNYQYKTRNHKS